MIEKNRCRNKSKTFKVLLNNKSILKTYKKSLILNTSDEVWCKN